MTAMSNLQLKYCMQTKWKPVVARCFYSLMSECNFTEQVLAVLCTLKTFVSLNTDVKVLKIVSVAVHCFCAYLSQPLKLMGFN